MFLSAHICLLLWYIFILVVITRFFFLLDIQLYCLPPCRVIITHTHTHVKEFKKNTAVVFVLLRASQCVCCQKEEGFSIIIHVEDRILGTTHNKAKPVSPPPSALCNAPSNRSPSFPSGHKANEASCCSARRPIVVVGRVPWGEGIGPVSLFVVSWSFGSVLLRSLNREVHTADCLVVETSSKNIIASGYSVIYW